jgi:hypothetical protein
MKKKRDVADRGGWMDLMVSCNEGQSCSMTAGELAVVDMTHEKSRCQDIYSSGRIASCIFVPARLQFIQVQLIFMAMPVRLRQRTQRRAAPVVAVRRGHGFKRGGGVRGRANWKLVLNINSSWTMQGLRPIRQLHCRINTTTTVLVRYYRSSSEGGSCCSCT